MEKFTIKLYVEGTMMNLIAHGQDELAKERKELATVLGEEVIAHVISLPPDDPGYDFYILTQEQFLKLYGKNA